MKATIRDVARMSGVSVATVSRILNNLTGYSEETKKRVEKVMVELDYSPNAIARGLTNKQTSTIGVLIPSVSSRFAAKLLQGIEMASYSLRHSVIVCNTQSDGERTMEYLKVLKEKRIEGLIFVSEWLKDEYAEVIGRMGVPVVLASTISPAYHLPYVKVDDKQAAYDAVEYLIKKGHRKIGLISGSEDDHIAGLPRIEGYIAALEEYGIPVNKDLIVYGDFHFKSGITGCEVLFERDPEITAFFATSDEMALGVISCAYHRGIKIPEDLSIIGFDDTEDAEMSIPPLTTIHQPVTDIGRIAAELLIRKSEFNESVIVPHRIIERKTVGIL